MFRYETYNFICHLFNFNIFYKKSCFNFVENDDEKGILWEVFILYLLDVLDQGWEIFLSMHDKVTKPLLQNFRMCQTNFGEHISVFLSIWRIFSIYPK